jgi:hypothetical protein
MHGFFKEALTVDVSSRSCQTETLEDDYLRAGLGGKGLGNPAAAGPQPRRCRSLFS